MLFASGLDIVGRFVIVLNRGIRAWNDGDFSVFLGEWVALPLIIVGVPAAVFFLSKLLKK